MYVDMSDMSAFWFVYMYIVSYEFFKYNKTHKYPLDKEKINIQLGGGLYIWNYIHKEL